MNRKSRIMQKIISLTVLLISFSVFPTVLAAPPDSPYRPGATLNPSCSPGDTNCTVSNPVSYDTTNINIPVGTTTSASLLELYSSSTSPILTVTSATSTTSYDPYLSFRTGAVPATKFVLGIDYSDSNKFKFATSTIGTNDILVLDQNGRVGIGTSTPAYKLDVWGDFRVNTSSTLGNVISGVWQGTALTDPYISSAATWSGMTPSSTQVIAGTGLAGGGALTGNVTLNSTGVLSLGTATGTLTLTSPLTMSSGVLSMPTSTASQSGYLSSADWTTFNNKQNAITLASSTSGTDFTISSSSATWTFNLPSATSTANTRGLLTAADWTTFNNKQAALWLLSGTNLYASSTSWNVGIGTTTPSGLLHLAQGTTTILYASSTSGRVGIGTASPQAKLDVYDGINSFQGMKTSDASTTLLLHMDGIASSTAFLDSGKGKEVTANGNAQIDTAQSKFGGSSGKFDGTGDYLSLSDSADWNMGSGAFTIDVWVYFTSYNGDSNIVNRLNPSTPYEGYYLRVGASGVLQFYTNNNTLIAASSNPVGLNQWVHLAAVGDGTNLKLYINGVNDGSGSLSSLQNYATSLLIGRTQIPSGDFLGSLDELRISKGIARWTSNFTPPSRNYGRIEVSDLIALGNVGIGTTGPTANLDVYGGINSFQGMKTSDASTTLLLHMDGMDGANASTTSFLDSGKGKTVTTQGNAQIDTAQSKFGGASGLFDGTGDYLSLADSADWDFGTGDFTIDFWVRFNALPAISNAMTLFDNHDNTSGVRLNFNEDGGGPTYKLIPYVVGANQYTSALTVSTGVWYHIALVRVSGTVKVFFDGVQVGTDFTGNGDVTGLTNGVSIGSITTGTLQFLNGWLDEFRISKGIARWTANFTPPSRNYGRIEVSDLIALGNVGIGTTTPSYLLHVSRSDDGNVAGFTDSSGTCTINPINTALVCSSDINLKQDITSFSGSLEKVLGLNPVNFRWKNQKDETWRFGFIAQEVEKIIPELVFTGADNSQSLNYLGFTPFLVGAIQEQQKQIEELKLGFVEKIKQALASLGLIIENGVAQLRELAVEKIFAKRVRWDRIEMADKATGEIYCTWTENGEWVKLLGECQDTETIETIETIETEPQPEPEVQPELQS